MAGWIFLNLLALGLCLPPQQTSPGKPVKTNPAATSGPPISWHAAGEIKIPFEYFRQHIYVTVSINGKPGLIFMLDSGANRNILNLRTARKLGIQPKNLDQAKDIGFGNGRIYVGPEENVDAEIGSNPIAHTMSVMDLNRFEQHFHHPTDGMLGYPFLRRFVVEVDYQRKVLTLLPPDPYRYRGLGLQIPLKPSRNFVIMPVTVGSNRSDRHQVDLAVDTGSNGTLMLYERFVRPLNLEGSFRNAQPGQAYGLNGYYSVWRGSIASLQIGDAETRDLPADFMRDDDEVGPERNLPGAIGNGILQSFPTVIFDVPHRRIIFKLKPPPWQSGLVLQETYGP